MTIERTYRNLVYRGDDNGEIVVIRPDDSDSQWTPIFRHEHKYPIVDIRPTDVDMVFDVKTPAGVKTYYLDLNLKCQSLKPANTSSAAELKPLRKSVLHSVIREKVLVLDGAMGTMIQAANLTESDFRGDRFMQWKEPLKGCNDILSLTMPQFIHDIHSQYLRAGAHIIETNTFNANAISLADYKMSPNNRYDLSRHVAEINFNAARIARNAVLLHSRETGSLNHWVAGSVGPTGKSLSMSSSIDGEGNGITWQQLVDAYTVQMTALIAGGVDILLIETIFDGLNAKAALFAAKQAMERTRRQLPIMLSVTLSESGRTLSGQTLDAFAATVAHGNNILSIGLNCGFGAEGMLKYIDMLQDIPFAVSVHPNAGLPDEMGRYNETPQHMTATLRECLKNRKLNIIGGCCGTTPSHIEAIAQAAGQCLPRPIPTDSGKLTLAGLEAHHISEESGFITIGERCNVAGSRKFLRLINEGKTDEAVEIARSQVKAGAQIIDINMDDAMLDAPTEIARFIDRLGQEPDIAKVPVMIDSSNWNAITVSLQHVQGRPIVNSISLKEGKKAFIEKARFIREMRAAVVVMAFDEEGQADCYERKISICRRAYDILVNEVGFDGCEIIFDPNVLAVATGIAQHNNYAVDFINATEWIKKNLPGAKVSGGISNLSFSFRGNNSVREAMHACFLHHAIAKGMDMAIVNPASALSVDSIPDYLREAIDDVLLNRRDDATERLIDIANRIKEESVKRSDEKPDTGITPESKTTGERLAEMIVKGLTEGIIPLLDSALKESGSAIAIIDGPLMTGINQVGQLFGEGKMFLPQVVKSAQAMSNAVNYLSPYITQEKQNSNKKSGRIVIATVKGDVHDIGKNIVNVIMTCNGFEMIDLGVMVPADTIVDKAIETNADFIALSGLITPSLEEMCNVARLMQRKQLNIPLLIGGATTSQLHTAVKIAPCYNGPVIYVKDAAMLPVVAQQITDDNSRRETILQIQENQKLLRSQYETGKRYYTIEEARSRRYVYDDEVRASAPSRPGIHDLTVSVSEAREFINWRAFFGAWKLCPEYESIVLDNRDQSIWISEQADHNKASEAAKLWNDVNSALDSLQESILLKGRIAILPAGSHDEEIIYRNINDEYKLPAPRQLEVTADTHSLSLADFIKPIEDGTLNDWIGLFAVTTGLDMQELINNRKKNGDEYNTILLQTIADRLVEAATEITHQRVKDCYWGFRGEGIRPAIGYPSLPDQRLVFLADKVLKYSELGISLTENGALYPSASTTGYIIAHPHARYFSAK